MSKLEDLQSLAAVGGILPDALVTVVSVRWFGSEALELTYKASDGRLANRLLYHRDEAELGVRSLESSDSHPTLQGESSDRLSNTEPSRAGKIFAA